jgi:hypothetical protein
VIGAIVLVVLLVLFPVVVAMSGAVAAAVLGTFLVRDAEERHAGSELVGLDT